MKKRKNEVVLKEDVCTDCMINPLSGEIFDPVSKEYVSDYSPYMTVNEINLGMAKFVAENNDKFSISDGLNLFKCLNGAFSNRVEYMLTNILKEYESNLNIQIEENLVPFIISEIRKEFYPIFNLSDYALISDGGCAIDDFIVEGIINYLVTFIMNTYIKHIGIGNDEKYVDFVNSNYRATSHIAITMHHMFETIFTEIVDYYQPTLACLTTIVPDPDNE